MVWSPPRCASFRPEIGINGATARVLVEQTGAVDVSRLGDHQGPLTVEEQWAVDLADLLEQCAEREGVHKSDIVRTALRTHLV